MPTWISRKTLFRISLAGVSALIVVVLYSRSTVPAAELFPDPAIDIVGQGTGGKQTAVFAGGCFWCTEAVFEPLEGVDAVISGYAGGSAKTAHYDLVSSGATDHAEAIQIKFNSSQISYGQLLKIFFSVAHDPTQLNRQGPDYGRQYRSSIFFADAGQKRIAEAYIRQLQEAKLFARPIVTEVVPLNGFYPAEDYHQDFVKRHPTHSYVVVNAIPKIEKLKKAFPGLLKK
jgi:peptide-methionine (S)-S-oxide reductase